MRLVKFLLFNSFTRRNLSTERQFRFLPKRLASAQIDFNFLLSVCFPFIALAMLPIFFHSFGNEMQDSMQLFEKDMIPAFILFGVLIVLLFNKDFFGGRSIAKRQFGYQVLDAKTNQVASEFQCMLRNITSIIWPIEVLVTWVSPQRRIGDLIAGTVVKETTPITPESILVDMQEKKIETAGIVTLVVSALLSGVELYVLNPGTWISFMIKK